MVCKLLISLRAWFKLWEVEDAGEDASHVCVDDSDVDTKSKTGDSSGAILPESGEFDRATRVFKCFDANVRQSLAQSFQVAGSLPRESDMTDPQFKDTSRCLPQRSRCWISPYELIKCFGN